MKNLISLKVAGNIILTLMALLAVFHLLLLLKLLPSGIVWGGRLENSGENLITLEVISLIVTLIFILIVAAKVGYIFRGKYKKAINVLVWIMCFYFVLNMMGNIASTSPLEKIIFIPVSIILAVLSFRLALEK